MTDKMLEHTRAQLSALFDGELGRDEARFLRKRLEHDVEQCRQLRPGVFEHLVSHRVARSEPSSLSMRGLSCWSIASRARKIRERTVPMGQSIFSAISS